MHQYPAYVSLSLFYLGASPLSALQPVWVIVRLTLPGGVLHLLPSSTAKTPSLCLEPRPPLPGSRLSRKPTGKFVEVRRRRSINERISTAQSSASLPTLAQISRQNMSSPIIATTTHGGWLARVRCLGAASSGGEIITCNRRETLAYN